MTWTRTINTRTASMVVAVGDVPVVGVTATWSPTETPIGATTAPVSANTVFTVVATVTVVPPGRVTTKLLSVVDVTVPDTLAWTTCLGCEPLRMFAPPAPAHAPPTPPSARTLTAVHATKAVPLFVAFLMVRAPSAPRPYRQRFTDPMGQ